MLAERDEGGDGSERECCDDRAAQLRARRPRRLARCELLERERLELVERAHRAVKPLRDSLGPKSCHARSRHERAKLAPLYGNSGPPPAGAAAGGAGAELAGPGSNSPVELAVPGGGGEIVVACSCCAVVTVDEAGAAVAVGLGRVRLASCRTCGVAVAVGCVASARPAVGSLASRRCDWWWRVSAFG